MEKKYSNRNLKIESSLNKPTMQSGKLTKRIEEERKQYIYFFNFGKETWEGKEWQNMKDRDG